ncbi:hypothetical protein [Bacillus safensis]|uniref:hypothetical protein n=1 Tax=Bacillus safensis TaxID=561879 RepID=UPI001F4E96E7|nr:hypothetical protein [Bacillus safensis]
MGPKGRKTENRKFAFQPNGVWHYGMRYADEKGNAVPGMPETSVEIEFFEEEHKMKLIMRSQFVSKEVLQQVMDMGVMQGINSLNASAITSNKLKKEDVSMTCLEHFI